MKKSILLMSLLSGTAFMLPNGAIAYDIPTLTHTPKLEPTFEFTQLDKAYKTAGVCFLGIGDCAPSAGFDSTPSAGSGGSDESFDLDTTSQCLNEGFTPQSCNSVQTIDGVCPYNSAYGRGCKCKPGLISCPAGQVGVGESCNGMYASCVCDPNLKTCSAKEDGQGAECGGKYESCVCKPEYQYDAYNCTYPQSTSGDECGGKYTECVCPEGVDEGEFGCAEYYPVPCYTICKIAYADNCHVREDNTGDYGCEKVWEDCDTKCEIPYYDNCRKRTAVNVPANGHCTSTYDDCTSKCSAWACNAGYIQSGNSCINPCDNRTAVNVPANGYCSAHYSDCSSKCSDWACNSGYEKSGNSCVKSCTPSCTNQTNCSWGSKTISDGCGGTCVQCYPPCTAGYKYNFSSADCFYRPAKYLWQSTNPNCGKCICDNTLDCGGRVCPCSFI